MSSSTKYRGSLSARSTPTPKNITTFGCRIEELIEHSLRKSRSTPSFAAVSSAPPIACKATGSVAMKNNRLAATLRLPFQTARLTSPSAPEPSFALSSIASSSNGIIHRWSRSATLLATAFEIGPNVDVVLEVEAVVVVVVVVAVLVESLVLSGLPSVPWFNHRLVHAIEAESESNNYIRLTIEYMMVG